MRCRKECCPSLYIVAARADCGDGLADACISHARALVPPVAFLLGLRHLSRFIPRTLLRRSRLQWSAWSNVARTTRPTWMHASWRRGLMGNVQ
jgi:hypothetical protein